MKSPMPFLQSLGRAVMLPIAVLPVAGLLLRLGQPDLLNIGFVSAAGDAMFAHLGLLFAVGVATGFARDGNGAAAMAGVVCYLVVTNASQTLLAVPPETVAGLADATAKTVSAAWLADAIDKLQVPIGIVSGLVGGLFYNRFATLQLPDYLAFFGGRRLVPILAGLAGLALAGLLGLSYPTVSGAIDTLSRVVAASGGWGLFAFGALNRLLIVTGLHHILNNVAYFMIGNYAGKTGDLSRFFAGDPSAGAFMSGFFPIMMFGLPAACLAMYHTARPERRKATGGMLFSLALTSFLTGVTEPIEFSFMFLAPFLYAIHALLTGLSEVIMNALGVRLGYGFSAGLFDYVLNYGLSTRPLLLLPVGGVYALVYYGLFRWVIVRFDLHTPGREPDEQAPAAATSAPGDRAQSFLTALGGAANLVTIDACTTRLRLAVADSTAIDAAALKALGARGVLRPSPTSVQVVVGGIADALAMELRGALDKPIAQTVPDAPPARVTLPEAIQDALGGSTNITAVMRKPGRWRVAIGNTALVDAGRLTDAVPRGIVVPVAGVYHLLDAGTGADRFDTMGKRG